MTGSITISSTSYSSLTYKECFNASGNIEYYYHDTGSGGSWSSTPSDTYNEAINFIDNNTPPTTYEPDDNDWHFSL